MDAAPPPPSTVEREPLSLGEIRDVWPLLAYADRIEAFLLLPRDEAEDFFFSLSARDSSDLVCGMPGREQRSWMRRPTSATRCSPCSTSRPAGR
jgi:hypothetical protein